MTGIADRDFGELNFDGVWTGLFEILVFGSVRKVELVIQVFDECPISEVQRLAFREFDLNKNYVSKAVEEAVFSFYFRKVEEYREGFDADEANIKAPKVQAVDDMRDLVSLRCIKVMSPFDSGSRRIGFIFDATFDPQLGLGVLVTNGSVETVDTQDFLLG